VGGHASYRLDAQKKTPQAREREREDVVVKRAEFAANQSSYAAPKFVFVDESGFRLGSPPHYGWAPRGHDSVGKTVQGSWKTMTMIGALALDGFRGFMTIDTGTSSAVFRAFVGQQLVPKLKRGDLVVMDNLRAHKDSAAIAMIRAVGADVLFLPPYSPEYNPIDTAWAKLKECIRRLDTLTREAFDTAVATAMATITPQDIGAWTAFAGDEIPA
jgi:transposase